ncbi:hypothetical protein MOW14_10840 [Acinetobacter indicus]|uniref:hypothetical protein n=1 Tax=Acinetobacter TaxID=469 RepID=UPI0015D2786D|nr:MULTISPECIES: hypothetical protein [Acinetobacter]MDM1263918.1 hypothetical protein [Acinetobacter indicus]MDM1276522.1 hypothetical protein [Acinetobacter indicus]QSQ96874.1 hypothetical protein J0W33_04580 [Acinetobacter indicus]UNW09011.1 hypothetical protein MOW14_10840 [Acinetobacter indicus]
MKILYLLVAVVWVLTIGSAIYFKIDWFGYDYNTWAIIFSALHGLLAAIIAMFGSTLGVRNSAKASNGSTVIQAGRDVKLKEKIKSKSGK